MVNFLTFRTVLEFFGSEFPLNDASAERRGMPMLELQSCSQCHYNQSPYIFQVLHLTVVQVPQTPYRRRGRGEGRVITGPAAVWRGHRVKLGIAPVASQIALCLAMASLTSAPSHRFALASEFCRKRPFARTSCSENDIFGHFVRKSIRIR